MCSSYCVFLELTNVESSDQDGKETQVSFKTFEGDKGRQESRSVFEAITLVQLSPVFSWKDRIPQLEKLCTPSKAQHSGDNP